VFEWREEERWVESREEANFSSKDAIKHDKSKN
jgi:hypothetical protein